MNPSNLDASRATRVQNSATAGISRKSKLDSPNPTLPRDRIVLIETILANDRNTRRPSQG